MKYKHLVISALSFAFVFTSCKKDEDAPPEAPEGYSIPTTYNFTDVNYSGQTTRLQMLTQLSNYMKSANTSGVSVDATVMKNMFSNTGNPFGIPALDTSGKQLENKCFAPDVNLFRGYMDSLANASLSTVAGSNGVAGVVVSTTDASKKYLFDENGVEYTQIIEKGLMGAVFYYQAINTYLSPAGMNVDNSVLVPGNGTAMQHHWDEAFGYVGAPIDFPSNLSGLLYWAKYSNTVNPLLSTNATLMNAFLKGRAAINNNDYTVRDEQIVIISKTWEIISAASAIHYINESLTNIGDDALRNHSLSEAVAFIKALFYNANKTISEQQILDAVNHIGANFYNVTPTGLNNAKNLISTVYDLDAVKDNL